MQWLTGLNLIHQSILFCCYLLSIQAHRPFYRTANPSFSHGNPASKKNGSIRADEFL